jgi:hypothetical protein
MYMYGLPCGQAHSGRRTQYCGFRISTCVEVLATVCSDVVGLALECWNTRLISLQTWIHARYYPYGQHRPDCVCAVSVVSVSVSEMWSHQILLKRWSLHGVAYQKAVIHDHHRESLMSLIPHVPGSKSPIHTLKEQVNIAVPFQSYSVRISTWTPAITREVFVDCTQSLQTNAGIIPRSGNDRFLPHTFQFTVHQWFYQPTLHSLYLAVFKDCYSWSYSCRR